MYNDELYHHGILGQKWGKQNGPPYPLKDSDHSASEKKHFWKRSLNDGYKKQKSQYRGEYYTKKIRTENGAKVHMNIDNEPDFKEIGDKIADNINIINDSCSKNITSNLFTNYMKNEWFEDTKYYDMNKQQFYKDCKKKLKEIDVTKVGKLGWQATAYYDSDNWDDDWFSDHVVVVGFDPKTGKVTSKADLWG